MGAATRTGLLALALLTVSLASTPVALATEEQVPTPAGVFYVTEDHAITSPDIDRQGYGFCLTDICFFLPSVDPGSVDVTISVWQETNNCPGLQEEPTTCADTGEDVSADQKVAEV